MSHGIVDGFEQGGGILRPEKICEWPLMIRSTSVLPVRGRPTMKMGLSPVVSG